MMASLYPAIRHFGMIGAVSTAAIAYVVERIAVGWRAAAVLGTTRKDLALFTDVGKAAGASVGSFATAYIVREVIAPDLLIARLAITILTFISVYVVAMLALRLPGSEKLTLSELKNVRARVLARLRSA
jgi:hypothetical protein